MAKKPEPSNLFWLTYRHSDGRAAGVVVIESHRLLHARLKASLAGADRGLEFVSGHRLDPVSAGQIPANMILEKPIQIRLPADEGGGFIVGPPPWIHYLNVSVGILPSATVIPSKVTRLRQLNRIKSVGDSRIGL